MAQIPTFSLPILNTQYETIQKTPTSNWMTALGQGADMVSKAAGQYKEYKDWEKEEQKKKELEAMLNSAKNDKERLDILNRKLEELNAELSVVENERNATIESAQTSMEGYKPQSSMEGYKSQSSMEGYNPAPQFKIYGPPGESRRQMTEAFDGMSRYPGQAPEETMTPINTFGFTPMVFPQLRG